MFDLFIDFLAKAMFVALHMILVLGLIGLGLALNKVSAHFTERQRQKALEIIAKGGKR